MYLIFGALRHQVPLTTWKPFVGSDEQLIEISFLHLGPSPALSCTFSFLEKEGAFLAARIDTFPGSEWPSAKLPLCEGNHDWRLARAINAGTDRENLSELVMSLHRRAPVGPR
jgi:hypothetical protein